MAKRGEKMAKCAIITWVDSMMPKPGWLLPHMFDEWENRKDLLHYSIGIVIDREDYVILAQSASEEWDEGGRELGNLIKIPRGAVVSRRDFEIYFRAAGEKFLPMIFEKELADNA